MSFKTHEWPKPSSRLEVLELLAIQHTRLSALEEQLRPLSEQKNILHKQRAQVIESINQLERTLVKMREGVRVSDHAVVRYLERRYGFDFEGVRAEIATPQLRAAAKAGAAGWKVEGGTFKISDGTVTTYVASGK